MYQLYTLSWFTFFISLSILIAIFWTTTKTRWGRIFIKDRTPWNERQWLYILAIISTILFIMVNHFAHAIIIGVAGALYYLLVIKGEDSQIFSSSQIPNRGMTAQNISRDMITIRVKSNQDSNTVTERYELDKAIYTVPYIEDKPLPQIIFDGQEYLVSVKLSSPRYLASCLHHLRKIGLQATLQKNN